MNRTYLLIDCQLGDEALIIQFRLQRLDENQINTLTEEILHAGQQNRRRRLILRFGPKPVECMYSVFLAKLITIQRLLAAQQTSLILCEVPAPILSIFRASRLEGYFLFAADPEQALRLPLPDLLPGQGPTVCQKPGCDHQG